MKQELVDDIMANMIGESNHAAGTQVVKHLLTDLLIWSSRRKLTEVCVPYDYW